MLDPQARTNRSTTPIPRPRDGHANEALPAHYTPGCYKCGRPNATGWATLMSSLRAGSRIAVCAAGVGCKDGRIYHGPTGPTPHWPGEDCRECERQQQRAKGSS